MMAGMSACPRGEGGRPAPRSPGPPALVCSARGLDTQGRSLPSRAAKGMPPAGVGVDPCPAHGEAAMHPQAAGIAPECAGWRGGGRHGGPRRSARLPLRPCGCPARLSDSAICGCGQVCMGEAADAHEAKSCACCMCGRCPRAACVAAQRCLRGGVAVAGPAGCGVSGRLPVKGARLRPGGSAAFRVALDATRNALHLSAQGGAGEVRVVMRGRRRGGGCPTYPPPPTPWGSPGVDKSAWPRWADLCGRGAGGSARPFPPVAVARPAGLPRRFLTAARFPARTAPESQASPSAPPPSPPPEPPW